MAYRDAARAVADYRTDRIAALLGETAPKWFTAAFSSIADMLKVCGSEEENREVASTYATGTTDERIAPHLRLDYVCGLRREIRKQYVSGGDEDGVYTDLTPFRQAVIGVHGAGLFDAALDQILSRKGDAK